MRMSTSGATAANTVNAPLNMRLVRSAIGMTSSMEAASFFPQYCAAMIPEPAEIPLINRFKTNWICPDRDTADREVWLTAPSIMASVALTSASINCCIVIGSTRSFNFW